MCSRDEREWEQPDPAEAAATAEIGLPDEEITTWVDTTAFGGQKFDALAAHASQGAPPGSRCWTPCVWAPPTTRPPSPPPNYAM